MLKATVESYMDSSLFGYVQLKPFWLFIWHVSLGWKCYSASKEGSDVP